MSGDSLGLIEEKRNGDKGGDEELGCSLPTPDPGTISTKTNPKTSWSWPRPCQCHPSGALREQLSTALRAMGLGQVTQPGGPVPPGEGWAGARPRGRRCRSGRATEAHPTHVSRGPTGCRCCRHSGGRRPSVNKGLVMASCCEENKGG